MSIEEFRRSYMHLHQQIQQFKSIATDRTSDLKLLQKQFAGMQQHFQQIVQRDHSPEIAAPVQSVQTEISKQLRLLSMDVMYLQAARQSATVEQRRSQLLDRVEMLSGYCQALLSAAD
jgi:hypothetical protein